ncbi:Hsp70 family protein [Gracilibacillus salinarum]|uniref:Chaperone protein DnaK n=1 Tax=Gracilibacillus salinarum TaxID=2932255 RepID=A0ABY4GHH6_9BACI|nr:Hsp70 family protein [Gracilibacillus salinarum]UOQ83601.1 Hsp70 family protein [Gracilibacillus salinarum]
MSKEDKNQGFRPIVGIDLGTTNSAVAHIHQGKPEIIPAKDGSEIVPSVVLIDPNQNVIVGEDARAALIGMPDRTKATVKREMGETASIPISGKNYLPEEVSAMILQSLKEQVDERLGEGEKEAVITVPAYFTDEQRKATKKAGELAGFIVERIINEPTAAALAYGLQNLEENRHILVYDLGGGTFDVSVVEMMDGILEVKASTGNSKLGGEDFDWLLVEWLAEAMLSEHGVDPRQDVRGKALLKEEAEKIKKQLSAEEQVDIAIPVVVMKNEKPLGLYKTITRDSFVTLISPLLDETMAKVEDVLTDAELAADGIDNVLLVGGSTRIPKVHALIEDYFQQSPQSNIDPDLTVAYGAAVQGGLKSGALSDSGMIVTDVAPFSMGIAVIEDVMDELLSYKAIIPRNTTIPVTRSESFCTVVDHQTEVHIQIFQGEHELARDNHFLNEFVLKGLPASPAGAEAVEVTFRYNLNGILEVTAASVSTGESMTVTLQDAMDRSSEEALQQSKEKVEAAYQGEDELPEFDQPDLFDLLDEDAELEELLKEAKQWKNRCKEAEKTLSGEDKVQVQHCLDDLNEAIAVVDEVLLEEAIDEVTDLFMDLEL